MSDPRPGRTGCPKTSATPGCLSMKPTAAPARTGAGLQSDAAAHRTGRCTLAAALAVALGLVWPGCANAQPSAAERAQAEEMVRQMDRHIESLKRDITGSQGRLGQLDREHADETARMDELHAEQHRLALRLRARYRTEHELQQINRRLLAAHLRGPSRPGDAARAAELQREMAALESEAPLGLAQRLLGGQLVRLRPDGRLVAVAAGTPSDVDMGRLPRPAPSGDQLLGEAERGIVLDLQQSWSGLANEERTIRPLVDALNRDAQGLQACRLEHPPGGERLQVRLSPSFAPAFMVDRHRILRLRMHVLREQGSGDLRIETFIPLAAVAKVDVEPRLGLDCWTVSIQCSASLGDCAQVTVLRQTLQAAGTLTLHVPGPSFASRAAELLGSLARSASQAATARPAASASPAR